jgi:hypothetical protein
MKVERVYERPHALMIQSGNLALIGWRDTPNYEDVIAWHQFGKALAREFPEGSACIDLVIRGTPNFSDDVRRASVKMAADPHVFPLAYAHIIVLPGFAGTAVRSFIQTVITLSRTPSPSKVFGDAKSASVWLAPKMRPVMEEAAVEKTMREFEATLSR